MKIYDLTEYGIFDSPRKAIYSEFHQKVLVMGDHVVYSFDPISLKKKPVQATEDVFVDLDVASNGQMLLLWQFVESGIALARVFAPNLFTIVYELSVPSSDQGQWQFQKGVFFGLGKAVVAGELTKATDSANGSSNSSAMIEIPNSISSEGSTKTIRFYAMDCLKRQTVTSDVQASGSIIAMSYDSTFNCVFATTSGGDLLQLDAENKASVVGYFGSGGSGGLTISAASFGHYYGSAGVPEQEASRVYVGSKPWAADRWDSGEIDSSELSLPYGGGDNLAPGQKYWVHIMVKTNGQWSAPQIKSFVVPKE